MHAMALWDSYMAGYDFLTKVNGYQAQLQDIAGALGAIEGQRILDAGSGTGNLSVYLRSRGADVISCDGSKVALAVHRKKDPEANLLEASLEEPLPLADRSFQGICCASVLFALSEAGCKTALKEFHRLLSDSGVLVLTVPTDDRRNGDLISIYLKGQRARYGWLGSSVRLMRDVPSLLRTLYYGWRFSRLPVERGFRRFRKEELAAKLNEAGFASIHFGKTYDGTSFLVRALKR